MTLFKSFLLFVFQCCAILFFAFFALSLKQDNSIDSFTVHHHQAEENHQTFLDHFSPRENFLVVFSLAQQDRHQELLLAEKICEEFAAHPAVISYSSYLGEFPQSIREQLYQEIPSGQIGKELPFPFLAEKHKFYSVLFQLDPKSDKQQLFTQIKEQIAFFEFCYPQQIAQIHLLGEAVVNYYLGESSQYVKDVLFPLLISFALLLLLVVFRSYKVIFPTALAVLASLSTVMGVFALNGHQLNLLTTLIPTTIFVLAIALQMHLLLSVHKYGNIERALNAKLVPNLLVTLTTSIGFGSLMTSHVEPIALMGSYMSLGMWVIFFWSYITHLGFSKLLALSPQVRLSPQLFLRRFHFPEAPCWLLVIPFFCIGFATYLIPANPLESNGLNYFSAEHPIRQDTQKIERNITGSSKIELLLPRVETKKQLAFAFYQKVSQWEKELLTHPHIRDIVSLNSHFLLAHKSLIGFDRYDEQALEIRSDYKFRTIEKEIHQVHQNIWAEMISPRYYRIQVICNSLNSEEFYQMENFIQSSYQQAQLPQGLLVTGPLSRIIEIQDYLLLSLSKSLLITISLVLVLIALFLRRVEVVWVGIAPNLFPLACMGIVLGVWQTPTNIATVMVFSIAFGIAVDDTIHFLHSYYTSSAKTSSEKWQDSLEINAIAVFTTSLVLAGSFLIMGSSSFLPIEQFGILLAVGMVSAFLGDIIFLPIILRLVAGEGKAFSLFLVVGLLMAIGCDSQKAAEWQQSARLIMDFSQKQDPEKWLSHPDWRVRRVLASVPSLPEKVVGQLVQDKSWLVRIALAQRSSLAAKHLQTLAKDPSWKVRLEIARREQLSAQVIELLFHNSHWRLAAALAKQENLSSAQLKELAKSQDWRVRYQLAQNAQLPLETLVSWLKESQLARKQLALALRQKDTTARELLSALKEQGLWDIYSELLLGWAKSPQTSSVLLHHLAQLDDWEAQYQVAANPNALEKTLRLLANSYDEDIRLQVVQNSQTPKRILQLLAEDEVTEIATLAQKRLKQQQE